MKKIICIMSLALLLSGCATPLLKWPDPPRNEPKSEYSKTETKNIRPATVTFTGPDGKPITAVLGYEEHYESRTNAKASEDQAPTPLWRRLLFSWKFWLLVLAIVFVPGFGALLWGILSRIFRKTTSAAGQMVAGIDRFLESDAPEDMKKKLLETLSKTYDNSTKKFVADVKAKQRS